jgi:putative membrane protein
VGFACLNAESIEVNVYFYTYHLPLSLLLVLILGFGILVGFLGLSRQLLRCSFENVHLKSQLKVFEKEVSQLRMIPIEDHRYEHN